MVASPLECQTCGTSLVRNQKKFCSTACQMRLARERRERKERSRPQMLCAGCGTSGASPREKTDPRDYSFTRSLLCARCAERGGWGKPALLPQNPVATWL